MQNYLRDSRIDDLHKTKAYYHAIALSLHRKDMNSYKRYILECANSLEGNNHFADFRKNLLNRIVGM